MKRFCCRTLLNVTCVFALVLCPGARLSNAAELKEARVTQIIHDVKILPGQAEARPAAVNDEVRGGTAVRTGQDSRSELTFADLTIARLGANTVFSFDESSRTVDLNTGALLLRVPKNSGGAKISTAAVTAAITGTTMMAEYHPNLFKFVMLEGTARICTVRRSDDSDRTGRSDDDARTRKRGEDCVDISAGQMLSGRPGEPLGEPTEVDLRLLVSSSLLLEDFGRLGSEDLIGQAIREQELRTGRGLLVSNIVSGSADETNLAARDQRAAASSPSPSPSITPGPSVTPSPSPTATPRPSPSPSPSVSPSPSPSATPSPNPSPSPSASPTPQPTPTKFGTPPVIQSATLAVIDSGTFIQTDPLISRNGETDYGRIYRGPSQDGAPSDYFFGSTSAFDTSSGFNQILGAPSQNVVMPPYAPFAAFKFPTLTILGDPTISTTNNGATRLALIGVNGITTGPPQLDGGTNTLRFAGITTLLLATQSGSITLGSNAFADLNTFILYARGVGSNLTIGSMLSGIGTLVANAEGSVDIENGVTTGSFISASGVDFGVGRGNVLANIIQISAGNNLNFALNNFAVGANSVAQVRLDAGNTVNINVNGDQSVFNNAAFVLVAGQTINLTADNPTVLNFGTNLTSDLPVTFTAGTGGIQGGLVGISGNGILLTLYSAADINIYSVQLGFGKGLSFTGSITAAGAITATTDIVGIGSIVAGTSITLGGQLVAGDINAGTDISADRIAAYGGSITASGDIIAQNGDIELQQFPAGTFGNITAGGNIFAGGGIFTPGDPVVVAAGGNITAHAVITGTLQAGGNITIDQTNGGYTFGIIANHIMAGGTLFMNNVPSISPNNGGSAGDDGETFNDFSLTAGAIMSTGPTFPILSSNGGDANPGFADSNPGNGGHITLTITAAGLTIGAGGNMNAISANGGAYNADGPFGGGNGGTVDIVAAGNVVVSNGANGYGILATTGVVADSATQFGGTGGTVNITTPGSITIDGIIQVSSQDATMAVNGSGAVIPGRESASGGTIDLQSNLTFGSGITIGANGALLTNLSLAALNAGGTAGSITLSTMGADITVNGTVRADFGTVTMDQNDPVGATPLITLDGGTVQAATFNINGAGDLLIGVNNPTAVNIFGGTWNVAHDITLNAANTTFAYGFALNATAGNSINFTGGNSDTAAALTLPLSGDTTFTAGVGGINAQFTDISYSGAALNVISGGDITANSVKFSDGFARGNVNATGTISILNDLWEGEIMAGGAINVQGSVIAADLNAGTDVVVGQFISATSITAGGDISAGSTRVQNITSPTGVLRVDNGISPHVFSTDPSIVAQGAAAPHVYSIDSIISPIGIDFSGNQFDGIRGYSSGGILTINANSVTFDPASGIGPVNFNGADVNGFSNGTSPTIPGDGGIFTVNAVNDITVNAPITASSGRTNQAGDIGGAGGDVNLNSSSGTVSVGSTIQVSHADATPGPSRRSARGGNIRLSSNKAGAPTARAVAVNINNSGQLLALLAAAPAPGPGGKIIIKAAGANSDVNVAGRVQADRGLVDIRHNGTAGNVTLDGGANQSLNVAADVVKVAALGDNGLLRIGSGRISADTTLQLYATGFNGEVRFVGNVSLTGNSVKSIAGNAVTISDGVLVNVSGPAASVYVNSNGQGIPNANYRGFGGNGSTTGTFGGSGANNPQSLGAAPPLGPPPTIPGH